MHSFLFESCLQNPDSKCSLGNWICVSIFVINLIFTVRRYASAVYAVIMCLSVCHKSVCCEGG